MRMIGLSITLLSALMLGGCKEALVEIPSDKVDYVGKWEGPGVTLVISADGGLAYEYLDTGSKICLVTPLVGFEDNSFDVVAWFVSFDVTVPPHQENDTWKMVMNGVELTKTAAGAGDNDNCAWGGAI
jgi:hypothetical protein